MLVLNGCGVALGCIFAVNNQPKVLKATLAALPAWASSEAPWLQVKFVDNGIPTMTNSAAAPPPTCHQ